MAGNTTAAKAEVWQRGPIDRIPALLQPVAHALLQAQEELAELMQDFPEQLLWQKPAGLASPAFHLQHLSGVLDRVFTYARGEALTDAQRSQLKDEDVSPQRGLTVPKLLDRFNGQVLLAMDQLTATDEATLRDWRGIGSKQLPSTVIGLLFHAAEHSMRHLGQLLVTVKILQG